jgi:uncharacterized protein YbbC (DUF1343 family)
MEVRNGIDRLQQEDFGLGKARLGLITAPSGVSRDLRSNIDILRSGFSLTALYSPEHGLRGDIADGVPVETYTDRITGLPVYSLYGADNRPLPAMLENIDMLLLDIQDIGSRFYTFISTMRYVMEECARAGKPFVVLDRINPINGVDMEGTFLDMRFSSFVGAAPIIQRHGMTMGELAGLFNKEYNINCDLRVIPLTGWKRGQYQDETGLCWVNPSPNMPSLDTALLYPGTCLFEGTSISEGRGTTKPFEMIGAPWLDAEGLAQKLNGEQMPGLRFRPVYFRPESSKHRGKLCGGVQAHITSRRELRPVAAGLRMLEIIRGESGANFEWLPPAAATGHYFIDLLAGTDLLRKSGSAGELIRAGEKDAAAFADLRKPYLLYD